LQDEALGADGATNASACCIAAGQREHATDLMAKWRNGEMKEKGN
jgi:hypothetical protein